MGYLLFFVDLDFLFICERISDMFVVLFFEKLSVFSRRMPCFEPLEDLPMYWVFFRLRDLVVCSLLTFSASSGTEYLLCYAMFWPLFAFPYLCYFLANSFWP